MAHRVRQKSYGPLLRNNKGIEDIELVFVYNVDSGVVNKLKDRLHRTLSPTTYKCGLRTVTCGVLGTRRSWKEYVSGSDIPIIVMHRDEFKKQFPKVDAVFPAGFVKKGDAIEQFILSKEIERCKDVPSLEALIRKKIDIELVGS